MEPALAHSHGPLPGIARDFQRAVAALKPSSGLNPVHSLSEWGPGPLVASSKRCWSSGMMTGGGPPGRRCGGWLLRAEGVVA
jgi:hypothetical protein